ncbi:unnamed protein product [Ranitomeya imitator]|uniref:Uncharacterized protein n=1 Tax=Ranitomeya imitator TaxID=111125 RepID=A0ABN9LFP8_9NEOB|nr:unnamed protein product [Ranitomeya imitator]
MPFYLLQPFSDRRAAMMHQEDKEQRLQRYNLPCLKHVSLILMRLQRYNTPLPKQESLILTVYEEEKRIGYQQKKGI